MHRMTSRSRRAGVLVALALIVVGIAVAAGLQRSGSSTTVPSAQTNSYPPFESARLFNFAGDWSKAGATTVRTIYPAQSSWQWLTSSEHPGSTSLLAGTSCAACHGNPVVGASSAAGWAGPPADHKESAGCQACHGQLEQRLDRLGERLVASPKLEPEPIAGKRPYIDVAVKAAYDAEYLYLRMEWGSERPGIVHNLLRWDGQKWASAGGPKPDAPKAGLVPSYEDRLTINVADADIPAFDGARTDYARAGCWISCHDSMRAMPLEPKANQVKAEPYFGDQGLKQSDIRKYLLITRSKLDATGGWDKVKPKEEIVRLLQDGQFLDMWMWRGARSGPAGYADDNYVLEYRLADKGKSPFVENALKDGRPQYMYDPAKTGAPAVPEAQFEEHLVRTPLIEGATAVPMDPGATFTAGDILSRQIVRAPDGSRGDILANSRWENGRWVLEMRRKLDTGQPDDKVMEPGKSYIVGIAVFDDMVSNRRHHVSLPVTLGLDTPADIMARPVEQLR